MDGEKIRVYFAGSLFNAREIAGNRLLADAVSRLGPRYEMVLPQDLEQGRSDPKAIRDSDIRALYSCGMGIFGYDGTELDSGTVVEFMLAKFADKPALLFRTDFRGGGDQTYGSGGEPWNLMSSFFPRTRSLIVDSAALYRDCAGSGGFDCAGYFERAARLIIAELDALAATPPTMPGRLREAVEKWMEIMPGLGGKDPL